MPRPTRRDVLVASSAAAISAIAGAHAAQAKTPSLRKLKNDLRTFIPESMRLHNVPGLSLALARNHKIVWAEAFGLSDKEANVALTPDTVFEAASLSKPAYAYAVLKLVEEGKFSLERPLIEYFGRDLNPDEPRFKLVTAKHVLSHTSGIEPQPGENRPPKLEFSPGERFQYSPHAFDILQKAVEHAVGETIAPMTERMLLKPFGMTRSEWGWSEEYAKSGARGYTEKGEHDQTFDEQIWRIPVERRAEILAPYPFESVPNAAAGLHATPSDYARFLIEVMRPGKDDFRLSKKMSAQMLTPQVSVEKIDGLFWGLGFGLQRPQTGPGSFWHWGDWGLFQHYAVAYPEDGYALVVMTNTKGLKACRDVTQRALGRDQPAFDWLLG